MIKPSPLYPGATVAFISPSSSLSAVFPDRTERAVRFFESKGYGVKLGKSVHLQLDGRAGKLEDRLQDIHKQFEDSSVSAIITTAGGLYCNELLEHLDYRLIEKNPKIFCGYSDITLLHAAINTRAKLHTFYGPCAVTEFGEFPQPFDFTWNQFTRAVEGNLGKIIESPLWTDEFKNWGVTPEVRELRPLPERKWLHSGKSIGRLVGGCLPSLVTLARTPYDFDYSGKVLMVEIPEGGYLGTGMDYREVTRAWSVLANQGKLKKITGIILGRLFRQSLENQRSLIEHFTASTGSLGVPVVYGCLCSHADPKVTLPLGCNISLNSETNEIVVQEQGVQ